MPHTDISERALYAKAHYEANKPQYIARAKAHDAKKLIVLRQHILDYLLCHPCVDCGESNPIVLEFDHRPNETKKFAVALYRQRGYSIKTVQEEIDKCDVRCANCHRIRTYESQGWTSKNSFH